MNQQLDLSNVITVTILPDATNLGVENINTCALFSSESPSGWAVGQTFAVYLNPNDVATDFGSDSDAYAMAVKFFSQNPNPVGTGGYLVIIPLESASVQDTIIATLNSVYYFGIMIDTQLATDDASEFGALAAYVQSIDKVFFYASDTATDLEPGSPLDLVRSSEETHTRCLFYGVQPSNPLQNAQEFAAAYAGRALSVDFSGSLTAATMNLKQLATVSADALMTQTLLTKAKAAGIDVYPSIAGVSELLTSGENDYWDNVYNELWLKFALQTAGFNYLAGTNTKIPQTEPGMTGLKDAYAQVMEQARANGVIAPGSWTSPNTFGDQTALKSNVSGIGYYIYSRPIAQQSQADRVARKAPLVQIAAKLAGAIHSSNVQVNVNA
jgi:hypothetical protein